MAKKLCGNEKVSIFAAVFGGNCGNSSVGRAQPCQGWGREFESRFPLAYLSKDARMVESVDTRDLKSLGHYGCAGSSPASSTRKIPCRTMTYERFFLIGGLSL